MRIRIDELSGTGGAGGSSLLCTGDTAGVAGAATGSGVPGEAGGAVLQAASSSASIAGSKRPGLVT